MLRFTLPRLPLDVSYEDGKMLVKALDYIAVGGILVGFGIVAFSQLSDSSKASSGELLAIGTLVICVSAFWSGIVSNRLKRQTNS